MKAFLIVLGLIVGIYLFLTPFRKHFNTIELQNETIIQKVCFPNSDRHALSDLISVNK